MISLPAFLAVGPVFPFGVEVLAAASREERLPPAGIFCRCLSLSLSCCYFSLLLCLLVFVVCEAKEQHQFKTCAPTEKQPLQRPIAFHIHENSSTQTCPIGKTKKGEEEEEEEEEEGGHTHTHTHTRRKNQKQQIKTMNQPTRRSMEKKKTSQLKTKQQKGTVFTCQNGVVHNGTSATQKKNKKQKQKTHTHGGEILSWHHEPKINQHKSNKQQQKIKKGMEEQRRGKRATHTTPPQKKDTLMPPPLGAC